MNLVEASLRYCVFIFQLELRDDRSSRSALFDGDILKIDVVRLRTPLLLFSSKLGDLLGFDEM